MPATVYLTEAEWQEREQERGKYPGRCRACLRPLSPSRGTKPVIWCSRSCTRWFARHPGEVRPIDWAAPERQKPKPCEQCGKLFLVPGRMREAKFCSRECTGRAASARYPERPVECSQPGCLNPRRPLKSDGHSSGPDCVSCTNRRYRGRYQETDQARSRRKTYLRKARTRRTDLSLKVERQMREEAKRCPLCRVSFVDGPYLPASKELDHIVPLNQGGSHTVWNVRIICRACNIRRPNDGSDVVQIPLFAI